MEPMLAYPFDSDLILRKKKSLRRKLLSEDTQRLEKKIAILGGSTTNDIALILELFLLEQGIQPSFYQSEYGRYWEDAMFPNPELEAFAPDLIYIHTTNRNLTRFPAMGESREQVQALEEETFNRFAQMWQALEQRYHCPIIQNNFEQPFYRLLGNRDGADWRGRTRFIRRLNERFGDWADTHDGFYLQDICWLSAACGLNRWQDPFYWHMYKYAPAVPVIPELAYNLSNIIKSLYGRNKKALALDLDNTLWGGIVGDDGPEHIEIGQETPRGQVFGEFQQYLKDCRSMGVMLSVDSKNEEENALAGLNRPDSVLHPDDFLCIRANWDPKDRNLLDIARELNIGVDAMVFVDDNPAERHIVRENVPAAAVPEVGEPESYITVLDRSGFFEVTNLSEDDLKRNAMYQANAQREKQQASFTDYRDYLLSLEMEAEIRPFSQLYEARIAQLTNKSNQFNLTTRRCTLSEIQQFAADEGYITLYGKLTDRFGDNGVVSVVFGHQEGTDFHIDLWLMSCRVLKRDMECAMLDALVERCRRRGIRRIFGYYYPTAKNKMVRDFYGQRGFAAVSEDEAGNSLWVLEELETYRNQNTVIKVVE